MKTRIIHTRFWQDSYICTLNHREKLLFIYLLTNEKTNIIGIYELPDKFIKSDLDITQKELDTTKAKFQKAGKFVFFNGWVKIMNVDKYNSYIGEKLKKAKDRELSQVPPQLLIPMSDGSIDTSMHTSIDTPNNHKSLIDINNNILISSLESAENLSSLEIKKDYSNIKSLDQTDFQAIAEKLGVPLSFVLSKHEDLENWHLMKPQKNKYANYGRALYDWVKRDAIKLNMQERRFNGQNRREVIRK